MRNNRVVVVTGAAGALGSVLVDRFLRNSDAVIATDTREALERWQRADGDGLTVLATDVTSEPQVAELASTIGARAGRVDVLINTVGFFPIAAFDEMTLDQWHEVIDSNLTSAFLVTQALLPLMTGRGWGRIINFSSGVIWAGAPIQAHYVAAKAGVVGFTRSLARAVGGEGITVNVVAPGMTSTPTTRERFPQEIHDMVRNSRAIVRDQVPDDIVGPVAFLASPDADFITGQTLNVDGGNFMM